MPITVPCRKCKTKFQVPSKLAGQTVRCKSCGCLLRLPSPERIQAKKQPNGSAGPPAPKRPAAKKEPAADDLVALSLFEDADESARLKPATAGRPSATATSPGPADGLLEPTVLSCGLCGGLLYYDPNFAGQTVACPHCGNHLIMPEL